jgi:hypothetical protein
MSADNQSIRPEITVSPILSQSDPEDRQRSRLLVVSYLARAPLSPRGLRTEALLEAFRRDWEIELVSGPTANPMAARRAPRVRSLARSTLSMFLLDKFEPWSWRNLRSLPPADAAYLVAAPFSPLAYAVRALVDARIPYVVDIGDPWILTADVPEVRALARRRARQAERQTWRHAAGAVLTTPAQAAALGRHFPQLPILVRPNGAPVEPKPARGRFGTPDGGSLRIAHFGNLYAARLDISSFLDSLALSGLWNAVELHVYGQDWTNSLGRIRAVRQIRHEPIPWREVLDHATRFHAALVIGNRDRKQLPSKAVDYLTLPIPRIAVTPGGGGDALAQYVADKPGWLVLPPDGIDAAERVREHVARSWSQDDLAVPDSERWPVVARAVADFGRQCLLGHQRSPPLVPHVERIAEP